MLCTLCIHIGFCSSFSVEVFFFSSSAQFSFASHCKCGTLIRLNSFFVWSYFLLKFYLAALFSLYSDAFRSYYCISMISFNLFLTSGTQFSVVVVAIVAVSNQRSYPFSFNFCTFKWVFFVILSLILFCNRIKSIHQKYRYTLLIQFSIILLSFKSFWIFVYVSFYGK